MTNNRRYAMLVILITNAILISFLDSLIPIPIPVPGIKLGLGNIITLVAVAFLSLKDVLFITIVRSFVVAILTRGIMMLPFSVSGGVLSALAMWLIYKKLSGLFSVKGVSMVGAMVHSVTQLTVASLILGQSVVMYYLPVLLIASVFTGLITGSISELTIDEICEKGIFTGEKGIQSDVVSTEHVYLTKHIGNGISDVPITKIDGFIKLLLAVILICLVFFFKRDISLITVSVFLVFLTLLSKIKPRTLLLGAFSYVIIVIIPYLFGFWIDSLFSLSSEQIVFHEAFLRLFRLFIIWYVSILYFHTTPTETVVGLLDKLLTPLKLVGIPVQDFLKVIMCIIIELRETGTDAKKSLGESMHSVIGNGTRRFRINLNAISQIIVSLIINSFIKIDRIQSFVEKTKPEELYNYSFKLSKNDGVAIVSTLLFTVGVWILEAGFWI